MAALATPAAPISLVLNGARVELDADPATPLLWALRDHRNLTGTKFGCGIGKCGACTVVVDGRALRSCVTPLEAVRGRKVTTIEGLATGGDAGASELHALQQAWITHQVPQCGYCQSGMLMAALGLLNESPEPTDAQIDAAMDNICRCGTYPRVRVAIHSAARALRAAK
ncbi:Isoquinoline 1-oxidoreductase subunit alpha [Burkholderiales bacterium]|nr:Isoquinoline 1-oxidoreductase subunit alpha [Burkholderiales bacterium]